MAAEGFWNYAVDLCQQTAAAAGMAAPAPVWQQSGHHRATGWAMPPPPQPQVARGTAPPPVLAGARPLKRQRPDYFDMPSGKERAGFHEAVGASYGHHLNNEMPYVGASQTARPLGGMAAYPVDNHQMMSVIGQ